MKGVFLLEEPIASLRPMRSLISQPKQTPKRLLVNNPSPVTEVANDENGVKLP